MRQINVSLGQRSYPILIGPGLLGRADERLSTLPVKRWAVVADETAASLYAGSLGLPVYTFPAGEGSKCRISGLLSPCAAGSAPLLILVQRTILSAAPTTFSTPWSFW